jgi:hypothetical protein
MKQRHDYDCALAALAILLDIPYGDIAMTAKNIFGVRRDGYCNYEIQTIAATLGTELTAKRKSKGYLENKTGILTFDPWGIKNQGHAVVLLEGKTIIDPGDGRAYPLDAYLKAEKNCQTILYKP